MTAPHEEQPADRARDEILARIRSALGPAPRADVAVPRDYHRTDTLPAGDPALVSLFADRVADYEAGVRHTSAEALPATLAEALQAGLDRRHAPAATGSDRADSQAIRIVVPPELPDVWLAAITHDIIRDDVLDTAALDACDAVITAAALAIAETGTIVLDATADQGRRALTLVPDLHLCVVRHDQIVHDLPDALPLLDPTRPLTWISGPSATSDIELDRVEGVHGPRTLEVVVVTA